MNFYAYDNGNPVRFNDPTGLYAAPIVVEHTFRYYGGSMYIQEGGAGKLLDALDTLIHAQKNYSKNPSAYHFMANNARDAIKSNGLIVGGSDFERLTGLFKQITSDDSYKTGNSLNLSEQAFSLAKNIFKKDSQSVENVKATVSEVVEVYGPAAAYYGVTKGVPAAASGIINALPGNKGTPARSSNLPIQVNLQFFGKKDLEMVNKAAKHLGMTENQRYAFGEEIEYLKRSSGKANNINFSWNDLLDIGREIMNWTK